MIAQFNQFSLSMGGREKASTFDFALSYEHFIFSVVFLTKFTSKPINPKPYYNAFTNVSIQPDMQKAASLGSMLVLSFHQLCYF